MALNLTSKKTVKTILNRYGIFPSKGLGQNFLTDKFAVKKVVKAAKLTKKDLVLEVGPGLGSLTQEIAKLSGQVIAVEKDPKLIAILKETLKDFENIEIIQGDILKIQDTRYKIQDTYKIVANLPFYIAAPVIRKFLESCKVQPCTMTLMVQKEVAQRICASPPKMNLLAVSVQFYAEPEIISYVSKKFFWPQPKVDSAIIKITPFAWAHSHLANQKRASAFRMLFFQVVRAGFSQPRKMLINNLSAKLKIEKEIVKEILKKNKISFSQRAETLTIKDWRNLARSFPF